MRVYRESEITKELQMLDNWNLVNTALEKEWIFQDFSEAMDFINMIAVIAEKHNHHPELYNVYNKVVLRFYTHDAGGITEKDFEIAKEIDKL